MKIPTTNIQCANQTGIRDFHAFAEEMPGVINLAIDHSDFETPTFIREAGKKTFDSGTAGYLPARGLLDLREAIAAKLKAENNIDANPVTEILVTAGTTPIVFSICQHLIEAGDEVIVVDPGFDYGNHIQLFGGMPIRIPAYESNGFKVDPEDIRSSVTDRTKMIIINTPSNPTGAILSEPELREIAEIVQENDLWILSDETYEHIVFDGNKHISVGSLDGMQDWTISAYTLSISYALTGWRVGYVAAPKNIIDAMAKLKEHMICEVAAVAQRVASAALTGPQDCLRAILLEYENRREVVHKGINDIDGISCQLPEATFYAFPNFSKLGLTSWNLAKYLMREHKVLLAPGSIFGTNGEGYMRLSFAIDPAKLKKALAFIKKGVGQLLYQ